MTRQSLTIFLSAVAAVAAAQAQTGTPGLASFDSLMSGLLSKYSIPGASLAVTYLGRLVMARGYGMADKEKGVPAQPDSLYRIASFPWRSPQ